MEGKKSFCTQCGNQIGASEKFCPVCGKPTNKEVAKLNDKQINVTQPKTYTKNTSKRPIILIIVGLLAVLVVYSLFSDTEFKEITGEWVVSDIDYLESMQLKIEKNGKAKLNILLSEDYDFFFNEGKMVMDFQLEKNQNESKTYQVKELIKLDIIVNQKMFELNEYDLMNSFNEEGLQDFKIKKIGNEVILSFENLNEIYDIMGSESPQFIEKTSENVLDFDGLEFYR